MNEIQVTGELVRPDTSNIITLSSKSSMPSEHEMMVFHTMAEHAVASKMYKGIGEKAGVMMIMLSARELGIPAMQALNGGLNIIQGKVEISARMMSALIRKAGHQIKVQECTPLHCVLVGKRIDTGEVQTSSFSVAEAQLAGLVKPGGGWSKWPKDMCFARALSRLARQLFSDVIGIGYVEGEISQVNDMKAAQVDDLITEQFIEAPAVVNEEDELQKFLNLFNDEEKKDAEEYVNVVKTHFKWSLLEAIQIMRKDDKLFEKFRKWLNNTKKSEAE